MKIGKRGLMAYTDSLVYPAHTDLEWVYAHTRLPTQAIEWESNSSPLIFDAGRGEERIRCFGANFCRLD
jgi:hypothetical protein